MNRPRTLYANEIDVRVQSVRNGKANMLLYIDSRAATDLLDETYGMENWTMEYKDVAGQIYGRLSVYDGENRRWIYREDTGSESNVEAQKGLSSDILKRCLVRYGVTELYSAPKIVLDDDGYGNTGYRVSHIAYNDKREIVELTIANRFGKTVYNYPYPLEGQCVSSEPQNAVTAQPMTQEKDNQNNLAVLTNFCTEMKHTEGTDIANLTKFYNFYKDKANSFQRFDPRKQWEKWNTPKPKREEQPKVGTDTPIELRKDLEINF